MKNYHYNYIRKMFAPRMLQGGRSSSKEMNGNAYKKS